MILADLGQQRRPRDAEEERCLSLVAAGEAEHGAEVAHLRSVERFRNRCRRRLGDDEIRRRRHAVRYPADLLLDHDMPCSAQCLPQRDDVVASGIGHQELYVKRAHRPTVEGRRAGVKGRHAGGLDRRPGTLDPLPMVQPLDIPSLAPGDDVHHPLLVTDVVVRGGDHPRTTLVLGNRTGHIESAPFWSGRDEQIRGIAKGMLVQVVGKVTSYRDSNQLEASSVRALPKGSVPLSDLAPSVGSTDRYWQRVDEVREKLAAPRLRAVLDLFYADERFRERYGECPGAPGTAHHARLGGLLQHTCEMLAIGTQIARVARADVELVVAGVLLHDIGKIDCYSWESGVFDTTERGRLIGHVVQGVIMLEQAINAAVPPPCTPDERLVLEHLILSHHGHLEFGAPVKPLTLEAEILHFADDASAKTASITDAYASTEYFPAGARISSKKIWQLDGRWMMKTPTGFGRDEALAAGDG